MSDNFKYFVFIVGPKGPEPQIWHNKQTDGNGKDKPFIACVQLLKHEEGLNIAELLTVYSFKGEKGEIVRIS